jgi:hypothetical protein
MKNPYKILNLPQNATKQDIMRALPLAVQANAKSKAFTNAEIMTAQKHLLSPAKRLAADFMFPAKYKTKRPIKLEATASVQNINLASLSADAFDTLNIA